MRIIIVEDEIKIREGMGKLIESLTDHIVLGEASDGEEGLDLVLRFKPDLVITDIRMPKMDGLEMIRRLYEQKIPVHAVILSGYSEFEYAKKAIQYGVDDYLLKPLAVDDVQDMLEKIEEKIKKEQLTKGSPEVHLRNLIFGEEQEEEKQYDILEKYVVWQNRPKYLLFAGVHRFRTGFLQRTGRESPGRAEREVPGDKMVRFLYGKPAGVLYSGLRRMGI